MTQDPLSANKAVARSVLDAFNTGNIALVDKLFPVSFVSQTASLLNNAPTIEGLKQQIQTLRGSFPDAKFQETDIVAEGDMVALRWTMTGTFRNALMGLKPTGQQVTHAGVELLRIVNGSIVDRRGADERTPFREQVELAQHGIV
jgi:predicted ester cyclase